jgi:hypothetical protein
VNIKNLRVLRNYIWKYLKKRLVKSGIIVSRCGRHTKEGFGLIYRVKSKTSLLQTDFESYQLYITAKALRKIKGDIAEVGVAAGGTAKIICEIKGDKSFHLFDTFEGLPKPDVIDDPYFSEGQYFSSLEYVKELLKEYHGVSFYKGLFPSTAKDLEAKCFSFVHLDVDIYSSTLASLKWFYPRMSRGGIIMSHDYHRSCGVRKAFTEFFNDKIEPVIQLIGDQCFITKL